MPTAMAWMTLIPPPFLSTMIDSSRESVARSSLSSTDPRDQLAPDRQADGRPLRPQRICETGIPVVVVFRLSLPLRYGQCGTGTKQTSSRSIPQIRIHAAFSVKTGAINTQSRGRHTCRGRGRRRRRRRRRRQNNSNYKHFKDRQTRSVAPRGRGKN